MATLSAGINATQTVIPVSGTAPQTGSFFTVGSENIRFLGTSRGPQGRSFLRSYWSVDRGVAGTTAAIHSSGATLTQYYPDAASAGGGGGSISATDASGGSVDDVTTLQVPSVSSTVAGTAIVRAAVVSETDPGAIGPGNIWLRPDPSQNFGPQMYVRNDDDDDWWEGSLTHYDGLDKVRTSVGLGNASASLTVGEDLTTGLYRAGVTIGNTGVVILESNDVAGDPVTGLVLANSGVTLTGLPTSDPLVVGGLWIDTAAGRVLKVSAG